MIVRLVVHPASEHLTIYESKDAEQHHDTATDHV
jgi:hypothetical protein